MTRCKHCGEEIILYPDSNVWVHSNTMFKICEITVLFSDKSITNAEPEDDET